MMKKKSTLALLFCSALFYSQSGNVGINTPSPVVTLDVTGNPSNSNSLDGILAPRLRGTELKAKNYTSLQTGALVYVTAADPSPSGQTVNVSSTGYYYFDGTVWKAVSPAGVDTTDDAWINNTTKKIVELGTKTDGTTRQGYEKVAVSDRGKIGIGLDPSSNPGTPEITIGSEYGEAIRIQPYDNTISTTVSYMTIRNDKNEKLFIGHTGSNATGVGAIPANTAFIALQANNPSNNSTSNLVLGTFLQPKLTIFADGKMGIGSIFPSQTATADLDINGSLRVRGIAVSTDFSGKNVMLTDTSGNVSQISTTNFVAQLGIPSVVLAAKNTTTTTIGNDLSKNNLSFNNVDINVGNAWNTAASQYVVPGNGYYEIYASSDFLPQTADVSIRLVVETSGSFAQKLYLSKANPTTTPPGTTASLFGVTNLSLKQGDIVKIYIEAGVDYDPSNLITNSYQLSNQLCTITRKTYN